jgi:hypothetical protein
MTDDIIIDSGYDPIGDPLHPAGKPCSICGTEHDEEDWGSLGWIGMLPVSFCSVCEQGIFNMVYQLTPTEQFVELIDERLEEISQSEKLDLSDTSETDID